MDAAVWDHSTFTHHRDRLLTERLTREFFGRVVVAAPGFGLLSDEHCSVDGTLIDAWASHKSCKPKDGSGADGGVGRDPETAFKGEQRSNATHASTTDPEARLYRKAEGQAAKLCYMAHGRGPSLRHGRLRRRPAGNRRRTAHRPEQHRPPG
jgi:hypothetical protein